MVKLIELHLTNDGVAALVVVTVKIVGDASLGIGQVGEYGPVADFERLDFEARPPAFGLGRTR